LRPYHNMNKFLFFYTQTNSQRTDAPK